MINIDEEFRSLIPPLTEWTCPRCNITHDRDHYAAINILRGGASTLVGGEIRPALAGILR